MLSSHIERILVVDDVPDNLFLLQALLEAEGYQVELASDGKTALAKIQELLPDLVLLDVMMPDMTGYEVTQQIRQNEQVASVPIVLITAFGETMAPHAPELEVNDFIRKPIDVEELLTRVKAFCSN